MRTTITLDDDVAAELTARQHRERRRFKDIVNETLRAGLLAAREPAWPDEDVPESFTQPVRLGAAPDITDVSAVLVELDEEKWGRQLGPSGSAAS